MPYLDNAPGLPGVGSTVTATPREIFGGNVQFAQYLPAGTLVSGTNSRDVGNTNADGTSDIGVLRCGKLMGKISNTNNVGVNMYAPSVLGLSAGALATNATSLYVPTTVATEIVRRIGASGTLNLVGPAAANGIAVKQTVTYSAVSGTTVTITQLGTNGSAVVTGALVQPNDGSDTIRTMIGSQYGVRVTDNSGNSINVASGRMTLAGYVNSSNIVDYPTDTGIQNYVKTALNAYGDYTFSDSF